MSPTNTFIQLDVILLFRSRLFHISAIITVVYIGMFYLLKPLGSVHLPLIILIYNDPVIMGYMFAGVLWLFDKNQNTLQAISVLPVNKQEYLFSKILILSILAVMLSIIMSVSAVGFSFNWFHLIFSVFLSSIMFCCIGFAIGSRSAHFLSFLMKSLPVFIVFALPMLVLFNFFPYWYFILVPSLGGILVMKSAFIQVDVLTSVIGYAHMITWTAICIWICYKSALPKIQ